ncbi:MAG: glutamate 5-kinase [Gammaproteobacteria bacterium RIFCSPHIGHO2_12_FULL_37_14]|nr:MAG: glutamate 5-kinase [Gammaproteobacteria bacterium RIFCSPHIGHO2_12_FULL_37_14]
MNYLSEAKRLVIKIGSSLLVDHSTGTIHREWLASLIADIVNAWQRGQQIIIVSSGAIPLGRRHLKLKNRPLQLEEKQAAAAVGQIKLAHAYQEMLEEQGITAAQILLTLDDSENRRRYLNAKNTLESLLNLRAIPVINENDTVATAEIRFGDNDRLAARVAQMVSADTLILFSDIDGLYTANPQLDPTATFIPEVTQLTADILAMAGESVTEYGSGGMVTKLAAAKIALASGCRMVIAAGKHLHPFTRIDQRGECTWFIPETTPTKARKNWIAQHLQSKGCLIIDNGAVNALRNGKSLLSVGVTEIDGDFHKGDAICILNSEKIEIARGLINYNAHDARKIMGRRSADFEIILGYKGSEEMIHRDDLVLI